MCTNDLLVALNSEGKLTREEVGAKLAELVSWNVGLHVLTFFEDAFHAARASALSPTATD